MLSCNSTNEKVSKLQIKIESTSDKIIQPDTIYNPEIAEYWWWKNDTVNAVIIDTICIRRRKNAIEDISNGSLCYYNSFLYYEAPQMAILLKRYNIEFHDFSSGCLGLSPWFTGYCYESEMCQEIENRFGEAFIDSLWLVAEEQFVLKYPDSIYMKDGMDIRGKYLTK
jgi:hypothetical protein